MQPHVPQAEAHLAASRRPAAALLGAITLSLSAFSLAAVACKDTTDTPTATGGRPFLVGCELGVAAVEAKAGWGEA